MAQIAFGKNCAAHYLVSIGYSFIHTNTLFWGNDLFQYTIQWETRCWTQCVSMLCVIRCLDNCILPYFSSSSMAYLKTTLWPTNWETLAWDVNVFLKSTFRNSAQHNFVEKALTVFIRPKGTVLRVLQKTTEFYCMALLKSVIVWKAGKDRNKKFFYNVRFSIHVTFNCEKGLHFINAENFFAGLLRKLEKCEHASFPGPYLKLIKIFAAEVSKQVFVAITYSSRVSKVWCESRRSPEAPLDLENCTNE